MKTYTTSINPSVHNLSLALIKQLPAKFNDKIKKEMPLNIVETGNNITVSLPAPYESYLYKIDVDGNKVNISKSEHYTDDVYSMAMEDVLTDLVIDFIGRENLEGLTPSTT